MLATTATMTTMANVPHTHPQWVRRRVKALHAFPHGSFTVAPHYHYDPRSSENTTEAGGR